MIQFSFLIGYYQVFTSNNLFASRRLRLVGKKYRTQHCHFRILGASNYALISFIFFVLTLMAGVSQTMVPASCQLTIVKDFRLLFSCIQLIVEALLRLRIFARLSAESSSSCSLLSPVDGELAAAALNGGCSSYSDPTNTNTTLDSCYS
jgi:hypothetical protein